MAQSDPDPSSDEVEREEKARIAALETLGLPTADTRRSRSTTREVSAEGDTVMEPRTASGEGEPPARIGD